jgi:hypothetical protein
VLSALLVAFSLEGLVPALAARLRRPVPVVRYDRVREPRSRTNLWAIARRLLHAETQVVETNVADQRASDTQSSSAATGARIVFFTGA